MWWQIFFTKNMVKSISKLPPYVSHLNLNGIRKKAQLLQGKHRDNCFSWTECLDLSFSWISLIIDPGFGVSGTLLWMWRSLLSKVFSLWWSLAGWWQGNISHHNVLNTLSLQSDYQGALFHYFCNSPGHITWAHLQTRSSIN